MGPEVEQDHLSAIVAELELLAVHVEPGTCALRTDMALDHSGHTNVDPSPVFCFLSR
jgi:hypothetical protein